MKSLNDSLREEFSEILKKSDLAEKINDEELDINILNKAFDILLYYKFDSDLMDKGRSEFENYLINHFKSKKD